MTISIDRSTAKISIAQGLTDSQKDSIEGMSGSSFILTGQSIMVDMEELRAIITDEPEVEYYQDAWKKLNSLGFSDEDLEEVAYIHIV